MALSSLPKDDRPDIGRNLDRKDGENSDPKNNKAAGDSSDPRSQGSSGSSGGSGSGLGGVRNGEESGAGKRGMYNDGGSSGGDDDDGGGGKVKDNRTNKKKRGRFGITRRRAASGGIAGTIVAVIMGGMGIVQGPFEVVHLGEILKKPFTSQDNDSSARLGNLLRFARSGEFGETRVTYFGSRSVAKTNERLKKMFGYEILEKNRLGQPITVKLDASKLYPGASTEEAAFRFFNDSGLPPQNIGIDAKSKTVGGNIIVQSETRGQPIPDGVMINLEKHIIGRSYDGKKMGKALTAIKSRPVLKFNGNYSNLHPWQKLKIRTMKAAIKFDDARRAKRAERTSKAQARVAKWKEKIKPSPGAAKGIGMASIGSLGLCVIKDIAHDEPFLAYENVRMPARNEVLNSISESDQIKDHSDFHITQPGAEVKTYTDKDGNSIWKAKALNALAYNNAGSGEDLDQDYKSAFSSTDPMADVENAINQAGGAAICGPVGQIALGAIGIVAVVAAAPTGGASVAAYATFIVAESVAVGVTASAIVGLVPQLINDTPVLKDVSGVFKGNIMAFASEDLANDFYRKSGGAELSNQATTEIDRQETIADQKDFESKSFLARTFDVNDYRSLTSRVVDNTDLDSSHMATAITNNLLSLGSLPSKLLGVFTSKAGAADSNGAYRFGFPKYGFSKQDLNNPLMENPYDNAEKAAQLLTTHPDFIDRAESCFGVVISQGDHGWQVDVKNNPEGDPELDVIPSTAKYISADCAQKSNDWLRIRLFIFDSRTMEAYACYDDDNEACVAAGIDSTVTADDGSSDDSSGKVSGSAEELAKKILDNGSITIAPNPDSSLKAAAAGDKSPAGIDKCGNQHPPVALDENLLAFLADLGEQDTFTINSLTTGAHACTSNHYKGVAVDLGCDLNTAKADKVGKKYGVKHNFESCSDPIPHWHYSIGGG
jgi:hypothetical protein